jgi:hypothetical protein
MAKTQSIRDQIITHLPSGARPHWEASLPADVLQGLEEVRADFKAGRLGPRVTKTGLSRAIAKTLADRGIGGSQTTVARWLDT